MKQLLIKMLACLLACIMLCSVFASCNESQEPQDSETEGTTGTAETPTETETTGNETETTGEVTEATVTETEPEGTETTESDTTESGETSETEDPRAITLETREDLFPNYEGYQNVVKDTLDPAYVLVEGEDYYSSTLEGDELTALGSAQSGGRIFYYTHTPDSWKVPDSEIDNVEWTRPLTVTYKVHIPYSGYYKLNAKTGDIKQVYTTNYSLEIDGKQTIVAAECEILEEVPGKDEHGGLFQILNLGTIYLKEGEHTFKYVLDWTDGIRDRDDSIPYGRISFHMDYFSLSRVYSANDMPTIGYDVDVSGDEDADILKNAANVFVFDERFPIKIDYVQFFEEAGTAGYMITDYTGKTIYRRYFNGEQNDIRKVEVGIKDHPTGYFTLYAGDYVINYVVTPALSDRTLEDTPFAMDFAALQLMSNQVERIGNYSAALRMAGVSWVRERLTWSSYQTNYQDGVSTFNDNFMTKVKNQIGAMDAAGLKVLLVVAGNHRDWMNEPSIGVGGDTDDPVTESNQLGYYGTQLAIYDGMKKIATELGGLVDILELANEPDHYRRDLAETYSSWFKAAALGTIDSGTNIEISIAGMCVPSNEKDFISLLMSSDVMTYTSIFNYHSHSYRYPGVDNVPDYGLTMNPYLYGSSLRLFGVDKPIWITESGLKLPSIVPSEEEKSVQASYMVSSTVQSLSYGTDKHFWFVASPFTEGDGDFGSFTKEDQPYPTIAAHAVMSDVLGSAKYIGELSDLPEGGRGYLFDNGERVVAVVWMKQGSATYAVKTDLPIIRTSIMGEEKLLTPKNGKVNVNIGSSPIYITYSVPPTDYLKQSYDSPAVEMPEVDFGDRVIITPEFEGYVMDYNTKLVGHPLEDGKKINVSVVNLNGVAVTGTVTANIPGFTLDGSDVPVTVEPYSEGYITLTLRKTSDVAFDDHVTFTGNFWDAAKTADEAVACSPTAVHVYTVAKEKREIKATYDVNLNIDKLTDEKALKDATVYIDNFVGNIVVKLDETDFDKFTVTNVIDEETGLPKPGSSKVVMDFSALVPGKYYVSIGCYTEGGDQQVVHLSLRIYGDGRVRFGKQW